MTSFIYVFGLFLKRWPDKTKTGALPVIRLTSKMEWYGANFLVVLAVK